VEFVSVCSDGLKANVDLLVNLQGMEDAAQLKIASENSTTVAFIDGTPYSHRKHLHFNLV